MQNFGTEERVQGSSGIAANPNVYAHVMFKGSDIKDLVVLDSQAPGMTNIGSNVLPPQQVQQQQTWYPSVDPFYVQNQQHQQAYQPMYWQPPAYMPQYNTQYDQTQANIPFMPQNSAFFPPSMVLAINRHWGFNLPGWKTQ